MHRVGCIDIHLIYNKVMKTYERKAVFITPEAHELLKKVAAKENRTLGKQVEAMLRDEADDDMEEDEQQGATDEEGEEEEEAPATDEEAPQEDAPVGEEAPAGEEVGEDDEPKEA